MKYTIPTQNLIKINQEIKRLNKKATKMGFEPITVKILNIKEVQTKNGIERKYEIEINHQPLVISGWKIIAKTEMLDKENSLVFPFYNKQIDLSKYNHRHVCDHCHTKRYRKITYILKHEQTNEIKQVGSTCVKDFTGINPNNIFKMLEYVKELDSIANGSYQPYLLGFEVKEYLARAIHHIKRNGFVSRSLGTYKKPSTADVIKSSLVQGDDSIKPTEDDYVLATEIIDFFKTFNKIKTSYFQNLKAIANAGFITWNRDGYVASMYTTYLKLQEKSKEKKEQLISNWVGQVGEKIQNINVRFINANGFSSYYGWTNIYNFQDEKGNKFTYFSTRDLDFEENDELTIVSAIVKNHKEYKNTKQTIITRCKFNH